MKTMYKFTLSIVLNKDMTHVLMCKHQKFHKLNFIGGKIQENESVMEASMRELYEETGITESDIKLTLFRHDVVELYGKAKQAHSVYPDFDMYITIGVLVNNVELKEEKNPLVWVDIKDVNTFIHANGDGRCYTYLVQGLRLLQDEGYILPNYEEEDIDE